MKNRLLVDTVVECPQSGCIETTYLTTVPKIFTAGDMHRCQSLVVWAISEGRECAKQIDEFLKA